MALTSNTDRRPRTRTRPQDLGAQPQYQWRSEDRILTWADRTKLTVVDLTAGSGLMLATVARLLASNGRLETTHAFDINPQQLAEATALLNAAGVPHTSRVGDSLAQDIDPLWNADLILVDPPALPTRTRDNGLGEWGYDNYWEFVAGALRYLRPSEGGGGRVFAFLPTAAMSDTDSSKARTTLVESDLVEAIVDLPRRLVSFTASPISMLILNNAKLNARRDRVQILDLSGYSVGTQDRGADRRLSGLGLEELARCMATFKNGANNTVTPRDHLAEAEAVLRRSSSAGTYSWTATGLRSASPLESLVNRYGDLSGLEIEVSGNTTTVLVSRDLRNRPYRSIHQYLGQNGWRATRVSRLLAEPPEPPGPRGERPSPGGTVFSRRTAQRPSRTGPSRGTRGLPCESIQS